jgi:hypothetical protein
MLLTLFFNILDLDDKMQFAGGRFDASAYNSLILRLLRFTSAIFRLTFSSIEYTIAIIKYTIFSLEYTIFRPEYTIAIMEYTIFSPEYTLLLGKYTIFYPKFTIFIKKLTFSLVKYIRSLIRFTSVIITSTLPLTKKPYLAGKLLFQAKYSLYIRLMQSLPANYQLKSVLT